LRSFSKEKEREMEQPLKKRKIEEENEEKNEENDEENEAISAERAKAKGKAKEVLNDNEHENDNENENDHENDNDPEVDHPIEEHVEEVTPSSKKPRYEEIKRDQSLPEFLENMETYTPIIPDAVTNYYLQRSGFDCDDIRVKRLIALATQKFIADIAHDALQYCKSRSQNTAGNKDRKKDKKLLLTMEDLSSALAEYGINASKPEYYT